jgi:1-acyl-sn-glycerol-3-phosphate acyltransferase
VIFLFYSVISPVLNFAVSSLFRIKVFGLENIPSSGGVILCANHASIFDPLVLRTKVKRPISFMAKKELFSNKLFSYALKKFYAFPVDRNSSDLVAYRKALQTINSGNVLGIFIQGTRKKDMTNAKDGASMFAIKSGMPVIPVAIISNYKFFSRVKILIGEKIFFEKQYKITQEILRAATQKITDNMENLIKTYS